MLAMVAAIYTGEYDIAAIMVKAGLGVAALVILVLSTVTTTFLDAYSAGVSSESLNHKINGRWAAIVVAIVGTVGAMLFPMDDITSFLYLIGSVFAPMIAIQIADYFFLKRDSFARNVNAKNLVIWVIGFLLYRLLMGMDLIVGNTLPDMVVTIILCLLANNLGKKPAAV